MESIYFKQKRLLIYGSIVVFLAAILIIVAVFQRVLDDPDIPLLLPEKGADWIRFREPPDLKIRQPQRQCIIDCVN